MSQSKSSLETSAVQNENWRDKIETEIEQNKLVDIATTALVIGVAIASRGRLTGAAERIFPKGDMLLSGNFVDTVAGKMCATGSSQLPKQIYSRLNGIDSEAARAAEIKRLTLLPTIDLDALSAARLAGEDSGALVEGRIYLTAELPRIIFKITKDGAESFLDGTPGNKFTEYLRAKN
jgi:hypothetical protein